MEFDARYSFTRYKNNLDVTLYLSFKCVKVFFFSFSVFPVSGKHVVSLRQLHEERKVYLKSFCLGGSFITSVCSFVLFEKFENLPGGFSTF